MGKGRCLLLAACCLLAARSAGLQAGQDPPTQGEQRPKLTSGVELIAVDVQVVRSQGEPVVGLSPGDFDVRIDGKPRRVVSAEFVTFGTAPADAQPDPVVTPVVPAEPVPAPPRRMFLIAVDEHSFRPGAALAAMKAAAGFIDRLQPTDLVGVFAYPTGSAQAEFTTDHEGVKRALSTIQGLYEPPRGDFHLSLSEIIDINASDPQVFAKVVARECRDSADLSCPEAVKAEATSLAGFLEMRIAQSLGGLRGLLEGLADVPGRKTLVLVSGGLIANDRVGGRPDATGLTLQVGAEALRANVTLYVLHMDSSFMESLKDPVPDHIATAFRDETASGIGLDMVAGAGGGSVIRVYTENLDKAFAQVLRETSAHYVLGIAVDESDRTGRMHNIAVRLKRRGATLRSRSLVMIPRPGEAPAEAAPEPLEELLPEPPQPPVTKPDGRTPSLAAVLKAAAGYLEAYEQQATGIVSEETYEQKSPDPDPQTGAVSRQLRSDMLIVPEAKVGWLGLRDVFEMDGQPVRDRSERLTRLFMQAVPDGMAQARRIVLESARFNLRSDIVRTVNMPMMALRFLRLVDQHRSKFRLEGLQVVQGTPAALVRFEERSEPRMIQSADNAAAKGSFWIEPGSGRVVKTELMFDTKNEATRLRAAVRVIYAHQAAVGTWAPVSMDEEYRLGKNVAVEGHATYANFRKFTVLTKETIK